MDFLTGNSRASWQPVMTSDTTTSSYWLNWRVLLCSIWIVMSTVFASFLIWKYEGFRNSQHENRESQNDTAGALYEDEVWKPCLKEIHPVWLLAFRVFAFFVLWWTFTLITIYFGLGSLLSMYGCYQYHNKVGGESVDDAGLDAEQGRVHGENFNLSNTAKTSHSHDRQHVRKAAGIWAYVFQIIFQMNAGAVMLTDCVFWFIIVPFLTIKDYNLNFLIINMHTINAVFLFGDAVLNRLRFPWFRIAYFFLWTIVFVVFQWIVHAIVSLWWPYPFLDLSSPFSPLWYVLVGSTDAYPCYGVFALIMKLKHFLLAKWFPESHHV
ncbi:hypothetical protein CK203_080613 [Vitis vinifera]|uniref:Uncharacterized protein n=1 Tax=Vitis vinifera TaxID=29760 RepID=A0A438EZ98_VITVI|nr:hypothetical protein CK203_080613 [Vitis vinifera]